MTQTNSFTSLDGIRQIFFYILFFFAPISIAGTSLGVAGIYVLTFIMLFKGQEKWRNSVILYGMIILLVGALLSSLFSGDPLTSLRGLKGFWHYLLPLFIYFAFADRKADNLLRLMAIITLIHAIYAILQHFTGVDVLRSRALQDEFQPYTKDIWHSVGTFSHHLTFGGVMLLIFPVYLAPALSRQFTPIERSLYFTVSVFTGIAAFFSMGRSIWLGLIFSIIVLIALIRPKVGLLLLVSTVGAIVFTISTGGAWIQQTGLTKHATGQRLYSAVSKEHNIDRLNMWEAGWIHIKKNPILGIGPKMEDEKMSQTYKEIGKKNGRKIQHQPHTGVHNIYLQTWLNYGLIGLIGYLLWWFGLFLAGIIAIGRKKAKESRAYGYLTGMLAGLAGSMVAGFFENNFRDGEVQTVIFILMGLSLAMIHQIRSLKKVRL